MKEKRIGIEGSAASRMVQLIRKHGYNKDVKIEVATVITPLPDLSIRLSDGITLDQDDLIISRLIASYTLKEGDQVIVIGDDDSDNYFVVDAVD